jgi:hypothetical protein
VIETHKHKGDFKGPTSGKQTALIKTLETLLLARLLDRFLRD